jgi:hypothetical protein
MSWNKTRLFEASLEDYTQALMLSQHWGRERLFIQEYFGDQSYTSTEEYITAYQHNICQWVQHKFFESLGFKKIRDCNIESGFELAAVYEDIECDLNKVFKGYSKAAVCYEKEDQKLLVIIEREDPKDIQYRIHTPLEFSNIWNDWKTYAAKNNLYKGKKISAGCRFLDLAEVTWDDVVLPRGMKTLLNGLVHTSIKNERLLIKNKLSLKRGILMAGSPGNGKTTALRVIIKEVPEGTTVIMAQPSHMSNSNDVRSVCQMARDLAPSILAIEDIDWIAEERHTSSSVGKVIELMNQLDGIEANSGVITIGTTNELEKIEKALKNRPGRFDRVISINNPDEDCRERMIKLFTKHWILGEGVEGVDLKKIVGFTNDLSGAHMWDLCNTAAKKAIDSGSLNEEEILILKAEHFDDAIKEVKDKDYSSWMQSKSGGEKPRMGFGAYPMMTMIGK